MIAYLPAYTERTSSFALRSFNPSSDSLPYCSLNHFVCLITRLRFLNISGTQKTLQVDITSAAATSAMCCAASICTISSSRRRASLAKPRRTPRGCSVSHFFTRTHRCRKFGRSTGRCSILSRRIVATGLTCAGKSSGFPKSTPICANFGSCPCRFWSSILLTIAPWPPPLNARPPLSPSPRTAGISSTCRDPCAS